MNTEGRLVAFGILVQLMPGVVAAFVWPGASSQGVMTGIIVGILITAYYTFVVQPPFGIHAGLLGFVANLGLVLVAGAIIKPGNQSYIEQFMLVADSE